MVRKLGQVEYAEALELQRSLQAKRKQEAISDTMLLLEHPPVLTLGKHASQDDILVSEQELDQQGLSTHRIERGGQVTYHGPGQLIVYLLIHLYEQRRRIRMFVNQIEQVIIELLDEGYGIQAARMASYPGVWVAERKIAAIGISLSDGVTMHGIALNVQPKLEHFNFIIPCGIRGYGQTSIEQCLGHRVDMQPLQQRFIEKFLQIFRYQSIKHYESSVDVV